MGYNPNIILMNRQFLKIDRSVLPVENFLSSKPVHCQRNEKPRIKSLKPILEYELLPTHLEVAMVRVNFNDSYYRFGQSYSINGNTRKFIWTENPEMAPNLPLYVTTYNADSREDIEKIYRSIDSENSVETAKHMISGLFRANNFEPLSKKIKSGAFATPLTHAYIACTGDSIKYGEDVPFAQIKNKIEFGYFKDEIEFLDKVYHSIEKDKNRNSKFTSGCLMTALLMMAKKYGVKNYKYIEMVGKLVNEVGTSVGGFAGLNDGVTVTHTHLYNKYNPIKAWANNSFGNAPVMVGKILRCLDAYMNDELLKIRKYESIKGIVIGDEKAKAYYRNYFPTSAVDEKTAEMVSIMA